MKKYLCFLIYIAWCLTSCNTYKMSRTDLCSVKPDCITEIVTDWDSLGEFHYFHYNDADCFDYEALGIDTQIVYISNEDFTSFVGMYLVYLNTEPGSDTWRKQYDLIEDSWYIYHCDSVYYEIINIKSTKK